MSFLVKAPTLPQSAAGADAKHSSGYKAADVVPVGWGRDVFPSKWISNKYDVHTQRNGETKPEWQYCSMAAAYRDGPIDFVGKVFSDGKLIANLDYTFAGGEESHEFTINPSLASGRAYKAIVHRGTVDTATSAVTALNAATGQTHPPYRGVVWIEWLNIDLGAGSTALPSLAVELGRHAPAIGSFAGGDSHPYGVNPFAIVHALCLAANAGDFDSALLDATHWGAQALALETTGVGGRTANLVHCHPTFTTPTTLADAISQILAYVDGYVFAREGKLCVGWFPSAAVDASTLPEIAEADLEAKPSGGGIPDWNEGATSVVVVFRSFDKDYDEDAARYNAPANRENAITAEPARKERPFVHASDQAAIMAAESATESSNGEISTNLTVLKSRATALMPGALVNWDYAPHSLDLVCRVTARRLRMGAASDVLTLTRERGAYPRPYVAPVDDRVLPSDDLPGEIVTTDVRLWLLPSGLTDLRKVAPLIDRTKRTIYRADLHLSPSGAAPWENILDCRGFAAKAVVGGTGINDSVTTVRVTSTSVDFARMGEQNAVAQSDDTLLLLLGDELVSVGTITVVTTNTYDLTILRGRRETTAAAHAVAVVGWLFYRSELASVEHAEFYRVRDGSNIYDATVATKHFKLQLFTIAADGLAKPDDPGISLVLPDLSADLTQGYTIMLTNEAHTVACDSGGTVNTGQLGAGGTAKTDVKVLRGSTPLTAVTSGPNSDQFSIALGTLTSTTATKEDDDTVRGDTLTADTGTIAIVINVAGAFTVTKLFSLTKAKSGATGGTGAVGPGLVYVGAYASGTVYYKSAERTDVVLYSGNYYPAANASKSGLTTWGAPGGADWGAAFTNFKAVATDLLLTVDATILKTLVMGNGVTSGAGIIRSASATAFGTGAGFWLGYVGTVPSFRVGDPSGGALAWDGTALTVAGLTVSSGALTAGTGASKLTLQTSGTPYLLFGTVGSGSGLAAAYASDGLACTNGLLAQIELRVASSVALLKLYDGSGALKCHIDGNSGDIKTGGLIKKTSPDGWTPPLDAGGNQISFHWDGAHFYARVDATSTMLF